MVAPITLSQSLLGTKLATKVTPPMAFLLHRVCLEGLLNFTHGTLKRLDPNPGDASCEIRALVLTQLLEDPMIQTEAKELLAWTRTANIENAPELMAKLGSRQLSKQLEFILHCALLAKVRFKIGKTEEGFVVTKTDHKNLQQLEPRLSGQNCKDILENSKTRINRLSLEFLREEVARLTTLSAERKDFLATMLIAQNLDDAPGSLKLASLHFKMQIVMARLRERSAWICLDVTTPEAHHFVHFNFNKEQQRWLEVPEAKTVVTSDQTAVALFNVHFDRETPALIHQLGLERTILLCSAHDVQFGNQDTPIKNVIAREELLQMRRCIKPMLKIDHILAVTLAELRRREE